MIRLEIKKTFFIQTINSFTVGVISIALPLLLSERKINIAEIGLIFSIYPIIFQLSRLSFGILSDFFGRKIFFVTNSFMTILSGLAYYFARTPIGFLFGKATEGLKDGSIWSVNRACILDNHRDKIEGLIHLRSFASVFEAIGSLLAGFLITWIFYYNTLLLCAILGILLIPVSFTMRNLRRKHFSFENFLGALDLRKKTKKFKELFLLFLILGIANGIIADYVFTLFLKQGGLKVEMVGIVLGMSLLLQGAATYFFVGMKFKKLLILSGVLYPLILILMGYVNIFVASFLLVMFGIANGITVNINEGFFSMATSSDSYGAEIGLLMTSFHVARTLSLFASGFLIIAYGFSSVFEISSVVFLIFALFSYRMLKDKD
jgi:MFS family permease